MEHSASTTPKTFTENLPPLRGSTKDITADPTARKAFSNQFSGIWPSYNGLVLINRVPDGLSCNCLPFRQHLYVDGIMPRIGVRVKEFMFILLGKRIVTHKSGPLVHHQLSESY